MSAKKDMRREDLIVPYQHPVSKDEGADFSSTITSTMPMAAMFTRNKFLGWAGLIFSIQSWLGESEVAKGKAATPGYFGILMSAMALGVTYMPLFLPPVPGQGTTTEAPAPIPPA